MDRDRMRPPSGDWVWRLYAVFLLLALLSLLLTGCKTRTEYVAVEKVVVRTDTLLRSINIRDSVYVHDSVYASERRSGDTVLVTTERWHTRWRDRLLHDTVYRSKTDSVLVPAPYPVVEEVRKPLRWWEAALVWTGAGFLVAAGIWIMLKIRRR